VEQHTFAARERVESKTMIRLSHLLAPPDERVSFDFKTIDAGHHRVKYRGVDALRSPFDYVIYQMVISEVKPDLIIEIGTNFGGGALYMADLLRCLGRGEVHSIDISDKCPPVVKQHPHIRLFHDGWEGYDLATASKFGTVLVVEDGSHMYEGTLGAIVKFAPVVSVGSYLIVEDGIVDHLGRSSDFNGGPCRAIREFLPSHPDFTVDRRWCDFFGRNATNNVNGYLKKTQSRTA
jgi:cephalosporin hydroxylase